jgi:hypothetical protein
MRITFALLLGLIWCVTVQRETLAVPGNTKLVAPGVWFREGELKDKGHCNNIWIKNWVDPQGLAADVEVVYKEITMGKPHGEINGGR